MLYHIEAHPPTYEQIHQENRANVVRTYLFFWPCLAAAWTITHFAEQTLFVSLAVSAFMLMFLAIILSDFHHQRADNVIPAQLCAEVAAWCKQVPQIDDYVKKLILMKREVTYAEYFVIHAYHQQALEKQKKKLLYGAWSN